MQGGGCGLGGGLHGEAAFLCLAVGLRDRLRAGSQVSCFIRRRTRAGDANRKMDA
jgi:hypothetical protein